MPRFELNKPIENAKKDDGSDLGGSDNRVMTFESISLDDIKEAQDQLRGYSFENRISYEDFMRENGGPYEAREVAEDRGDVSNLHRKMARSQVQDIRNKPQQEADHFKKSVELGRAFEGVLLAQMQEKKWLGENVQILIPTRYDDVINGVDAVIEVENDAQYSHLALGVDVASGHASTHKKIEKIFDEIRHGELAQMRYFHSKALGIRGQKDNIRRVIISADRNSAAENISLWMDEQKTGNEGDEYFQQRMRIQIYMELMLQLRSFALYAKRHDQIEIAQGYISDFKFMEKTVKQLIEKDISLNNNITKIQKDVRQDQAYHEMKELLEKALE